jgi:dTDP-4-dehydrorhamnose reductase
MLGSAVGRHLLDNTYHSVCLTYRTRGLEYGSPWCRLKFDPLQQSCWELGDRPGLYDYVINCIGTIKPFIAADPLAARMINTVFPWKLAKWCKAMDARLIHISTDCVYSGKQGRYVETDAHDALDDYGKSKSLGEPVDNGMVIRTSIIGEEIHKKASLIEWAKAQKGGEVKGFTNHYWNGITTKQYAKVCNDIIEKGLWEPGLFHVHAPDTVNKYQMMAYFNERFDLGLTINEFETPEVCDRSLSSRKSLCSKLKIPTVRDQILSIPPALDDLEEKRKEDVWKRWVRDTGP